MTPSTTNRSPAVTVLTTVLPTVPPTAPAQGRTLGFFAHHGVWAPGVRVFRRLRFAHKLTLMLLTLLLPVGVLLVLHLGHLQTQLQFTARERVGVQHLQELAAVSHHLLQTRNATRAMMGSFDAKADYDRARANTDAALAKLDRLLMAHQDPLTVRREFETLRKAWQATAQAAKGVDATGKRTVFGPVTEAAVALFQRVLDESGLSLDPDLDSFYLGSAVAVVMPQLMEDFGQLWGWSTFLMATDDNITFEELTAAQRRYAVWDANVRRGLAEYKNYINRVAAVNPAKAPRLKLDALAGAEAFRKAAYAFVFDGKKLPAAALYAQGQQGLAGLEGLAEQAMPVLDEVLHARQRLLQTQGIASLVVVALGLFGFAYLAYSFFLVMNGGLKEVDRHLLRLADGDLSANPHAWGTDEVARLLRTVARAQVSLRGIVAEVRASSTAITTVSAELAGAASDISVRSEQAAASLQQSASAMEEIAATVQGTSGHAHQAATIANSNKNAANSGGDIIHRVVQTMQAINDSSVRIGDIVGTIDGIAFQTNILALNAAVEAARAGEQGRGFAVVAAEVRALAQRSSGAAREIKTLIAASLQQVQAGVSVVRQAGQTMGTIVTNAGELNVLIDGIAAASRQQSQGVQQVGLSVQQLDRMTQQNAALVEQSAASAADLHQRAASLAEQVSRFRLPEAA
jgi:methyl-accepting chemotaxis protein